MNDVNSPKLAVLHYTTNDSVVQKTAFIRSFISDTLMSSLKGDDSGEKSICCIRWFVRNSAETGYRRVHCYIHVYSEWHVYQGCNLSSHHLWPCVVYYWQKESYLKSGDELQPDSGIEIAW